MEASTYAWAVILTFFIFYAAIQLRKCFIQLLSSGQSNTSTNPLSRNSVYTIENDSTLRTSRNDQEILGSMNPSNKYRDQRDLPTYEEVIASDRQNPVNSSGICGTISLGTSSSNTLSDENTSNVTVNR